VYLALILNALKEHLIFGGWLGAEFPPQPEGARRQDRNQQERADDEQEYAGEFFGHQINLVGIASLRSQRPNEMSLQGAFCRSSLDL